MKNIVLFSLAAVALAGCASSMPMHGGSLDEHDVIVAQCGVGNYTFRYSKDACATAPASTVAAAPAPTKATAPVSVSTVAKLENGKIEISKAVTFKTGSATITKDGMKVLDEVAMVINANANQIAKINIEGHTDATGNPAKNMSLSEARADSVKQYLSKKGIDSGKMTAKGFGQTVPKFDNLSDNRRVEFNVETTKN